MKIFGRDTDRPDQQIVPTVHVYSDQLPFCEEDVDVEALDRLLDAILSGEVEIPEELRYI